LTGQNGHRVGECDDPMFSLIAELPEAAVLLNAVDEEQGQQAAVVFQGLQNW
jgi:hypothetical protein